MKSLKTYTIPFTGLKPGKHRFDFEINDAFFNEFEYSLVKKGVLSCIVELDRQETMLVLDFKIEGNISNTCDRCLAAYPQPINVDERLIAKFSDEGEVNDEDIIYLTKNDHEINIAGFVYEYINVAAPFIAVCDDAGNKEYCDKEMLERLEKLASSDETDEKADPRWEALKKLK